MLFSLVYFDNCVRTASPNIAGNILSDRHSCGFFVLKILLLNFNLSGIIPVSVELKNV